MSQPDFADIGANVLAELDRRLGDPQQASELPGTLLMKLAENYLRYLERRQAMDADSDQRPPTALEIIDQPGLSIEYRYQILSDYLEELENEWREASQRMIELQNEIAEAVDDPDSMPE